MTRYAIGDIQGCYNTFINLLNEINFNHNTDKLYLVGDLVNRGPESLKVLQWVFEHKANIVSVLGNHDIYLLARHAGVVDANHDETITDILNFKDSKPLINWLNSCPLVFEDETYIITHAGIYPQLNLETLKQLSQEVTKNLAFSNPDRAKFLHKIFGNKPSAWNEALKPFKKIKFAVNSCTRMRFLNKNDLSLEYKFKGSLANCPEDIIPWFKAPFDPSITKPIIFGHWAALGFYNTGQVIAIDTGCVWGRRLTALNLENMQLTQVNYQG